METGLPCANHISDILRYTPEDVRSDCSSPPVSTKAQRSPVPNITILLLTAYTLECMIREAKRTTVAMYISVADRLRFSHGCSWLQC